MPMRDKLVAAGVEVEHICHDGMIHNFHAMGAEFFRKGGWCCTRLANRSAACSEAD